MKKNKILYSLILTGILIFGSITSCKKSYLDINTNPNAASDVTVVELLPSAQGAIAHVVGNHFQIYGGLYGQYWTQSPSSSQYKTAEQYSPSSDDFDRPWRILYSDALQDLKIIIEKSTAEGRNNYKACALILQAYAFQLLTDNFGDIPFSDALKGDMEVFSPKYDNQHDVYHGMLEMLEEADALIDENSEFHPHDDDLFFHGDMFYWRAFGNTLKLKMLLRLAYASPSEASEGILDLDTSGAIFLGPGEEVKINYTANGGNTHPLYSSIVGLNFVQNLVASKTSIDYMTANNDERLFYFYAPANNGSYVGIAQGDYGIAAGTPVAFPGPLTGGRANDESSAEASVRLMTGYESMFLQAEAIARGWLSGSAQTMYEDGIYESFMSFGIHDTIATAYLAEPNVLYPAAGTMEDQIKAIITQKWVSLNGNTGTEGWTEWRRTGYPDFFVESANSIIGAGRFPARLFYPGSEITRNSSFPGQKLIYDRVWWDVN